MLSKKGTQRGLLYSQGSRGNGVRGRQSLVSPANEQDAELEEAAAGLHLKSRVLLKV